MNVKLVRIGNSRGVRIPKPLIEEACLTENVVLRVVDTGILIERVSAPRIGWKKAAQALAAESGSEPIGEPAALADQEEEWKWE